MRKMVVIAPLSERHRRQLVHAAPGWQIVCNQAPQALEAQLEGAEVIGGWMPAATERCLRPGTALQWVQHWGAGVDYLPLEQFQAHGVMLTDASGVHAYPISETLFGMMLTLTRRLHVHIRNQAQRHWGHDSFASGRELHGKTIGIFGVGAIGTEVAHLAKAFRMRTLGVRHSGSAAPNIDTMFTLDGLSEVLSSADYIVNTLPLTPQTERLFGASEFAAMKPSALFFNVGRGGSVDQAALFEALASSSIAGAGLDVFEREPLPVEDPLWSLENLIISPHASSYTEHYNERLMQILLANLRDYLAGRVPTTNQVDYRRRY